MSPNVWKTLTFHTAVADEIKEKYTQTESERLKQVFNSFVSGKIMDKYRLRGCVLATFGIQQRILQKSCHTFVDELALTCKRRRRADALT